MCTEVDVKAIAGSLATLHDDITAIGRNMYAGNQVCVAGRYNSVDGFMVHARMRGVARNRHLPDTADIHTGSTDSNKVSGKPYLFLCSGALGTVRVATFVMT